MSHNPFEAPASMDSYSPETLVGGLSLATQGQRFGNFFIDSIVVQIAAMASGFVLGLAAIGLNQGNALSPEQDTTLEILAFALGLFVQIGYYVTMETLFQRTIGKLVTGTSVVTEDGGLPGFGKIVGRSFARLIPFEAFSFLGKLPTGWHDKLSGTRVIKSR